MQDTIVNQDRTAIDLTKVAAIQQKRTLAFVNHFVLSTIEFINNFAKQCEQKLIGFERKLEKINATMVLLEARLSSIPEVNILPDEIKIENTVNDVNDVSNDGDNSNQDLQDLKNICNEDTHKEISPEYDRFVKMVHVGVPLDAVKLKLTLEGLDPKILDQILGK